MKYILLGLVFLFPVFVSAKEIDQKVPETIARIVAERGTIEVQSALFITLKESTWNPTAKGDGHLICKLKKSKNYGKPIRSRGVWQINDCAHPEVTDKQAYDVTWSTHWAMDTMEKDGGCKQWSTCKLLAVK